MSVGRDEVTEAEAERIAASLSDIAGDAHVIRLDEGTEAELEAALRTTVGLDKDEAFDIQGFLTIAYHDGGEDGEDMRIGSNMDADGQAKTLAKALLCLPQVQSSAALLSALAVRLRELPTPADAIAVVMYLLETIGIKGMAVPVPTGTSQGDLEDMTTALMTGAAARAGGGPRKSVVADDDSEPLPGFYL